MSDSDFRSLSLSTASSSSIQVIESLKDLQNEVGNIFLANTENLEKMSSKNIYDLFSKYYCNFCTVLMKNTKLLPDELNNYILSAYSGTAVITYPKFMPDPNEKEKSMNTLMFERTINQLLRSKYNLFNEYCEVFKKLFKGNEGKGQLIIQVLENIRETYREKIKEEKATKILQPNQKGRARSCSASF